MSFYVYRIIVDASITEKHLIKHKHLIKKRK